MTSRIFGSIFLVVFCLSLSAQETKKDSLQAALKNVDDPAGRTTILLELGQWFLYQNNDSAHFYVLEAKNSLSGESSNLDYLEVNRLLAFVLREHGQLDSAIAIQHESIDYLNIKVEKPHLDQEMVLSKAAAQSTLASLNRLNGNHAQALEYGLDALDTYDSMQRSNPEDRSLKNRYGRAINAVAVIHSSFGYDDMARTYFKTALDFYEQHAFTSSLAYAYFNIGANYLNNAVYDSAIQYLHLSRGLIDSLKIDKLQAPLLQNLSYAYINSDYLSQAGPLIEDLITIGEERNNDEVLAMAYSIMSHFQRARGNLNKAISFAQKGLQLETGAINIQISLLENSSRAYEDMGRYEEALELWKEVDQIDDSLYNVGSTEAIAEIEAKYQNEKKEREITLQNSKIALLEKDNRIKALWTNLLLAGVALFVLTAMVVYRYYILKSKQKRAKLEASLTLEKVEAENQKLKAEKLNKELDFQNQKLTSYALNFVRTNEVFEEIKSNLADLTETGSHEVTKSVNRVNRIVDQNLKKESEWDEFKTHFEGVHKDFFLKLKQAYPDLTSNDLKICALTLLNLNLKESAVVLGVSPESVKIARYRLKKRMGLAKEVPLINHLMEFSID